MRHERQRRAGIGVLVALIASAILVAPLVVRADAQISPGPLAAPHASLDGPLSCTKCHVGGKASMNDKCLSCHREVAWLVERNRGLHARTGGANCASCHPDHAGRDFALVKWPEGSVERFNHLRVGWPLDGKHANVACEKCHSADLRVSPAAKLAPGPAGTRWIGLETACASCHTDVHQGSLARTCASCHTVAGWSPASRFDHDKSDYPLTGRHADVACDKCHTSAGGRTSDGKAVARFKPQAHADCNSCHRDPHAGRLRGTCSSCHVTTSFTSVAGRSFSHDQTRYPLLGRHASVSCVKCHAGYPSRIDRPAFATCGSCHTDYHRGQATIAGRVPDCASCHTVSGFTPSTFTIAQHAQTAYPLVGRHASVACARCHVYRDNAVVMRPVAARCESCHSDAHKGKLANASGPVACVTCHTPAGWKSVSFGVPEHAALPAGRFACVTCHADPHGGRYTTVAVSGGQADCSSCHTTGTFRPSTLDAIAHSRFAFKLEGAHRAAPCAACHSGMKAAASLGSVLKTASPPRVVTFTMSGATCSTCHGTPHGAQFASRPGGDACQSCHDLDAWKPASRFVHEANGGFVLGAAHSRVPCERCHVQPPGSAVRSWRGVPRACEACHRPGGSGT